ncbi:DHHA2 domain-containing protein [Cerasicoccus fimbriatus]|uniref:DHHA2 domain-containing protein n=1 Tax=Cerasicoccus fimbriatus TaxID=3014554 RepID=UPI0022B5527F|nr:DHHA2 domain-containing protein [Cerasicoccus sp. TK19100]
MSVNNIFVTGHQNPDTDSLVSAHVFAWMLGHGEDAIAATALRLGDPNPQSAWLFETAGEPLPVFREDCRPTIRETCAKALTIAPDAPLSAALRLLREKRAPVIVVQDDKGEIQGIISDRMPRVNYLLSANIEDMLGALLQWHHLVESLPLNSLNGVPVNVEPTGMRFVSGEQPGPNDILVTGPHPVDPAQLLAQKPAAIIVVGPERCPELEEQTETPVFSYHGSAFAFCASLGGCIPCRNAMETDFATIDCDEVLMVQKHAIADADYGLLAVDAAGDLVGVVTTQELADTHRARVALVDHFEKAQSIKGLDEAVVTAIVDHHRIGDIETSEPVDIDCRIWGSTASILFARCREMGITVPASKARLLLGALISDTLLLQSPTTREQDRRIARDLASLAGVDLQEFGLEVLRRNDRLVSAKASELVKADCKAFTHDKRQFLAAQIETVDLNALTGDRARELEMSLRESLNGHDFAVLMITDVLKQTSRLSVLAPSDEWPRKLSPEANSEPWLADGFVSRKKQLIPYILQRLDQ